MKTQISAFTIEVDLFPFLTHMNQKLDSADFLSELNDTSFPNETTLIVLTVCRG